MKKIITKFWGIAIVLVMLASLCLVAAPVSAVTPLSWNYDVSVPVNIPATSWAQFPGTSIVDFAISPDGMNIYAALKMDDGSDNLILLKSSNGGAGWSDLTTDTSSLVKQNPNITSIDYVAMSPDNPDIVVVLDATTLRASASTDGGLNFYDMGAITGYNGGYALATSGTAYGLDVSPQYQSGIYYVAVAGVSDNGTPVVYYYNFGASIGSWREAAHDFSTYTNGINLSPIGTISAFVAVKFSPNFAADQTIMALSSQPDNLMLHVMSPIAHKWNNDFLGTTNQWPVSMFTPALGGPVVVNAASIGLGPDFIGSDAESIISFIGAAVTDNGTEKGGIFRIDESQTVYAIRSGTAVNSIDYDGNTVVAGAYDDNNVFRVTDPLSGSPTAASARAMKRIGVDDAGPDKVIVRWAGETVFGSKIGAASALSKSTDMGNTWNDFTLMDSSDTVVTDVYLSPDGSVKFVAAYDGGEASIYRIAGMSSSRVLCVSLVTGSPHFGLRGLPDDPDVLYAFDQTGTDIYQTADGGVTRWSKKTTYPGGTIADLAVESATTIYVASGSQVYKSTNNGSGWNSGVDTLCPGLYSIESIGEGQLVVGGNGAVGWSTDGGATWAKNGPGIDGSNILVAATGLTSDDWIFVAPTAGNGAIDVFRAHPAPVGTEFKTMNLAQSGVSSYTSANGTATNKAMVLTEGILYVLGCGDNTTAANTGTSLWHSMAPTIPTHTHTLWGTEATYASTARPVLFAATGTIDLYAAFIGAHGDGIYFYQDIVSEPSAAPTLTGPADGTMFKIVSSMLADTQLVNFSWQRAASQITEYSLQVALDKGFTQPITSPPQTVSSGSPSDTVSYVVTRGMGWFDPGVTYYWRVSTKTPFSGAWSETRSFTIAPSIATVPELLTPVNGASITSVSPAFSWTAVTGTTAYDFELSELPGMETTIFTDQTSDAGEALPVTITLETGKTYFWRVRAAQPVLGDWSTVGNFMVVAPPSSAPPPVVVTQPPPITITVPTPPAPTTITVSPPPPAAQIAPAYIWAIIIIGAILVIAVIVLIVRTRRSV
jgi:hypothetical protein